MVFNQKEFIKTIFGESEFVKESYSIYGNGSRLYTQDGTEPLRNNNCEKSKQLLKEAGYDGRPVILLDVTVAFPGHGGALSIAAASARPASTSASSRWTARRRCSGSSRPKPPSEGGWNIHTSGQTLVGIGSPLTHPYIQAGEKVGCAKKGQPGWPCSPELGKLIDAFAEEPDAAKRKGARPADPDHGPRPRGVPLLLRVLRAGRDAEGAEGGARGARPRLLGMTK